MLLEFLLLLLFTSSMLCPVAFFWAGCACCSGCEIYCSGSMPSTMEVYFPAGTFSAGTSGWRCSAADSLLNDMTFVLNKGAFPSPPLCLVNHDTQSTAFPNCVYFYTLPNACTLTHPSFPTDTRAATLTIVAYIANQTADVTEWRISVWLASACSGGRGAGVTITFSGGGGNNNTCDGTHDYVVTGGGINNFCSGFPGNCNADGDWPIIAGSEKTATVTL